MLRKIWRFINDAIEALVEDDRPRQLSFDFNERERRRKRWHRWLYEES